MNEVAQAASIEETRKFLVEDMERGVIRLIAIDTSNIVGWGHIKPDRWEGLTHAGWLGMGVLKEYRGQGIGSALLHQASTCVSILRNSRSSLFN